MISPRPHSPAMDALLGVRHPVLDHGFIRVIDYMGDDAAVVQAARVSYGEGTKTVSDDRALIRYLMRNRHTSPFEMCEIKVHVKLPLFVARQWIRHRTANVNEVSGRYSILSKEFYIPAPADISAQSTNNKQGREETPLSMEEAEKVTQVLRSACDSAYSSYEELLEEHSLARELARMVLPTNVYTEWYWKVDLHNLLHFLKLRNHPHAQREMRNYAETLYRIVAKWVPLSAEAFQDYQIDARLLSKQELDVLRAWLQGQSVSRKTCGLSARELAELESLMGLRL